MFQIEDTYFFEESYTFDGNPPQGNALTVVGGGTATFGRSVAGVVGVGS